MSSILAKNGYTDKEILNFLQSNRTIAFEFEIMDNKERVITHANAAGNVSFNSSSEIMGTASLQIQEENLLEYSKFYSDMRVRPIFKLKTPNGWVNYPLGVFIMTSPSRKESNNTVYWDVDCYDKGIILKEDKLQDRLFIAAGSNYVSQVKNILLSAGIDRYVIESTTLVTGMDLEFEIGTSKLEVINDLLYAINFYPIHFNSNGFAETGRYVEPMQRETEFGYMTGDESVILPETTQKSDLFNVPNVVIRYINNPDAEFLRSIYVNDNPNSSVSTVRRGRRIVDVESVEDMADQNTLDAYTKRVAIEKSQAYDSVHMSTAIMPMHGFRNCIFIREDKLNIQTKYIEYAWSMDLEPGGSMAHELKRVVYL